MSRTYELIIRNETQDAVAQEVGGAGGIQTPDGSAESAGGEKTKKTPAEKALKQILGYKRIKSVASSAASYQISTVQIETGSREAQERASFRYNVVQYGVNIAEQIYGGFFVSGGNPVGAAVGLALGLVDTVVDVSRKFDRLEKEKRLEDRTRDLSAQRATYSGGRFQNITQG